MVDPDLLVPSICQVLPVSREGVGIGDLFGDSFPMGEVVHVWVDVETIAAGNEEALPIWSEGHVVDVDGRGKSKDLELAPIEFEDEGLVGVEGAEEQELPIVTEFQLVLSLIGVEVTVADFLEEGEVQPIVFVHFHHILLLHGD